jgi:hypothetical protein
MTGGVESIDSTGKRENMKMRFFRLFSGAHCFVLSAVAGVAQASGEPARLNQIKETIVKVRSDKTVNARMEAAAHLASLTKNIPGKEITKVLVADIASLLDSPDDSVRFWVAKDLGNLGPAAKPAAPKMEKMLSKADCINGSLTSADAIRYALTQMGIKPPPPLDCGRMGG